MAATENSRKVRWEETDNQTHNYYMNGYDSKPAADGARYPEASNGYHRLPRGQANPSYHVPLAGYDYESDGKDSDDEDDILRGLIRHPDKLRDDQSQQPEINHERLEWQQMLQSVLMGEVIKSERKRLATAANIREQHPVIIKEIWVSLRALLRGRTNAMEKQNLEESRQEIVKVLDRLLEFKVQDNDQPALDQVADLLKDIDRIEGLFPTRAALSVHCPKYASETVQTRVDALNAWCTITRSLEMQYQILKDWTGSDELQIARDPASEDKVLTAAEQQVVLGSFSNVTAHEIDPSFLERILKESALQDTFDRRLLSALNNLLIKSKQTMVANSELFEEMNLSPFIGELKRLAMFPTSLVEEALKYKLHYQDRLINPSSPMIDAMLEDYRGLLKLACNVRRQYEELATPAPGWGPDEHETVCINYDNIVMDAVRFYFRLIGYKLDIERENNLRECEVMEKEWEFLKETICRYVKGGDRECAEQYCLLTNRLLITLMKDYTKTLKAPETLQASRMDSEYPKVLQNMRMRARKLLRFARMFKAQFENAAEYVVNGASFTDFINALVDTDHFLVYTGTFEEDGVYVIASPDLFGRPDKIRTLIHASTAPSDITPPSTPATAGYAARELDQYVLILSPWQSFLWTGEIVEIPIDHIELEIKADRVRLVSESAERLTEARAKFWNVVLNCGVELKQERRAHIPKINRELNKIKRTVFKLADSAVNGVKTIQEQTRNMDCHDIVEECFTFASDFGNYSAKFLDLISRRQLDLKLVRLAIDWICFITDECVPTDRKTFRWAVVALDFGMVMTRGNNILALSEAEFIRLQSRVASCIALLISHFDVLGTKVLHDDFKVQNRRRTTISKRNSYNTAGVRDESGTTTCSTFGTTKDSVTTPSAVTYIRDEWMRKIAELEEKRHEVERDRNLIGKVLDKQRPEDQSLMFLAPSSSDISFRWQQGKFIGAGTFGSVYLAINLDTSTVMAVKEIRFPDSSSLSALHKSIKEEMKVMEMLQHPNIVQYFGMEVHRDKVNIFMEYCENGSLGGLLEHGGSIEDEMYVVDYVYQLLEGLAYLHSNNVVHRDIKPDNILIDHLGKLKFSDFGAAKILAKGQKTMGKTTMNVNVNSLTGTPMYMAPEVITGGEKGRKGAMDIWSLGCCIVEMTTGRRPWSNLDNEWAVMYHVATGCPPLPEASQLSEEGIDFLKNCFIRSPHKRPSAQELLQHPWITNYLDLCAEESRYEYEEDYEGHHNMPAKSPELKAVSSTSSRLVRSIAGSMPLEGHPEHVLNGAHAQQYFQGLNASNHHDSAPASIGTSSEASNNKMTGAAAAAASSLGNGSVRCEASSIHSVESPTPSSARQTGISSLRSEASSHD
ncbi:Suppressor of Sensor Kinase (SLN1) [Umbelopsis nana]